MPPALFADVIGKTSRPFGFEAVEPRRRRMGRPGARHDDVALSAKEPFDSVAVCDGDLRPKRQRLFARAASGLSISIANTSPVGPTSSAKMAV